MSQDATTNPLKILLVENSRTARTVLTHLLHHEGYHVTCVGSGLEAIEAILHSNFDVVIMDLFLPQLNGYEAAAQIRAIGSDKANIPIIAFTSSTEDKDKRTCLEAGMNEYVIKTADNKELLDVLVKYQKKLSSNSLNLSNNNQPFLE